MDRFTEHDGVFLKAWLSVDHFLMIMEGMAALCCPYLLSCGLNATEKGENSRIEVVFTPVEVEIHDIFINSESFFWGEFWRHKTQNDEKKNIDFTHNH